MTPSQNISEDFKNIFFLLTNKEREIFKYLHWFCQNYRSVNPCQIHIAEKTGTSVKTVYRAIKKFQDFGWMNIFKRIGRTCIYFVEESLLKLNLKEKKTFELPREKEQMSEVCPRFDRRITKDPNPIDFDNDADANQIKYLNLKEEWESIDVETIRGCLESYSDATFYSVLGCLKQKVRKVSNIFAYVKKIAVNHLIEVDKKHGNRKRKNIQGKNSKRKNGGESRELLGRNTPNTLRTGLSSGMYTL